jgi:hypothetical protein
MNPHERNRFEIASNLLSDLAEILTKQEGL